MTQMMMDDCRFFRKGISRAPAYCTALKTMDCREKKCSFYKPRLKDEADNTGEDKAEA